MATIEGYSKYLIFEDGEVMNCYKGKLLKQVINNCGYKCIDLRDDNGGRKNWKVHRLVGTAFIPNPHNKPQIDHIDEDKTNNCVSNLRWVTNSENQRNITKAKKNNKLGEKYITLEKATGRYRFRLRHNKTYYTRRFITLEEAKEYRNLFLKNKSWEKAVD